MTKDCKYDTAMIALVAGIMLAVPFSCFLVKALLDLSERRTSAASEYPTKDVPGFA